ncbi:Autolysin sensor kinase [Lysobacter capsici AZ78]|uniref:Autolysin sensor kinase n=1 Tax=Lysobacter capsici AZ78 TaxID=1444315 RepID=A0A120AH75_9GAMM|nr:histidine kinase [Lysobacter capsici]KWS05703.1 Autolysin sensor kinase [Lysobacter capsici AZ78]
MSAIVLPDSIAATSKRLFWPLQTVGWLGYFILHFTAAMGDGKPLRYVTASLSVTACGFAITSLLRQGYRRLWGLPVPTMAAAAFGLMVLATIVQAKLYVAIVFRYCDDCQIGSIFGYLWYFTSTFYILLSWSGLYFGIKFALQLQRHKELALRAQNAAHAAQIKMLRYQLNPHFLFNTLNAISTLVLDDKRDTAYRMIASLSAFLRHSLDSDPERPVALKQEVDALNLYLGIERVRFGERLQMSVDMEPAVHDALVPSLILQPLIENAIKHAVSKREEGGRIELIARLDGDMLNLHLRDDGPGLVEAGSTTEGYTPVGLANTRERLRVLYGERQQLTIRNREPAGMEVFVRLPFTAAPKA